MVGCINVSIKNLLTMPLIPSKRWRSILRLSLSNMFGCIGIFIKNLLAMPLIPSKRWRSIEQLSLSNMIGCIDISIKNLLVMTLMTNNGISMEDLLTMSSILFIDAQRMMKKHCTTVTIKHDWLHWHFYGGQGGRGFFLCFQTFLILL